MYRELAHLLLYSDLGEGAILTRLAGIFRDWEHGADRDELVGRIYAQIKRLLDLSTDCGFDENLWRSRAGQCEPFRKRRPCCIPPPV